MVHEFGRCALPGEIGERPNFADALSVPSAQNCRLPNTRCCGAAIHANLMALAPFTVRPSLVPWPTFLRPNWPASGKERHFL
jgi:hypothetical protein